MIINWMGRRGWFPKYIVLVGSPEELESYGSLEEQHAELRARIVAAENAYLDKGSARSAEEMKQAKYNMSKFLGSPAWKAKQAKETAIQAKQRSQNLEHLINTQMRPDKKRKK